jgi:2-(1,2-epoxy-1,2-dihydrophenyl)acetyl-CoA isomerase
MAPLLSPPSAGEGFAISAADNEDVILYELENHVATITLNRPSTLNALNRPARARFHAMLREAAHDDGVRAVVVTGAGRAFSVGQDVAELTDDYAKAPPALARLIYDEWAPLVDAIRSMPKPVLAAVNGAAAGGGLSLALAADIRLAEPRTRFIAAFAGVGLVPDSGAAHLMVHHLGLSKAMELALTQKPLGADEALRLGLAAEVAADADQLLSSAHALAERLAAGAPMGLAGVKAVINAAADAAFEDVVALEADWQDRLGRSEDHQEALRAFLEKRPPTFRGR